MSGLEARVRSQLRLLEEEGLFRRLRPPSGIDFSSNDYLRLSDHPHLKAKMSEAVGREGCGSTGSRLLRGEREAFSAIERRFASFKGTERALYFSSGYLANLAVLTTFAEAGDVILSDQLNHASLIDAARLSRARRIVFPHGDAGALAEALDAAPRGGHAFVVTESLFSMDGDVAPLAEYAALCRSAGALLVVDEAHAVGIRGARGSGLIEEHGLERDVFVSINTAGKALGVSGAFVTGPEWAIDYLVQRARPFIFSTAPPPSVAAALEGALDLVDAEPERRATVRTRARYLRSRLIEAGVPMIEGDSQIVPWIIGENSRAVSAAAALQAKGFDVRAVRPPSVPTGTARFRLTVNLDLTEETLDRFISAGLAAISKNP
jgi:8-amino-7-oxononanoate synthase